MVGMEERNYRGLVGKGVSNGAGALGIFPVVPGIEPFKPPFVQEVFLLETHVAGTTHIEGIDELEQYLEIGEKLEFFREPKNSTDSQAIVIKTGRGIKIGYVPRIDNEVVSRLMDAGKLIFGRIEAKEYRGSWLKINIKIYLKD